MGKAELGAKRRCLSCGAAFFDLNREPIVCPKCNTVFQVVELPHSVPRKAPYRPIPSGELVGDDQPSSDDVTSVETDAEAVEDETDDSVPQPIEEDDKIEEIDDLM